MFKSYNINDNTHTLSVRNMILIFLTIVMGFGAVLTLGQGISIPSDISNAQQTIAQVTITATGINTAPLIDMSAGGIFIDDTILYPETNFSGKVLGIDESGNLIYVLSQNLVVLGTSAGGENGHWTGNGAHIYKTIPGNVGIGTSTMSGKLHIKGLGETELYLEETNPGNAANINFKNTTRTRAIGGHTSPDLFYIGKAGSAMDFVVTPIGNVGIGTFTPSKKLHVAGTIKTDTDFLMENSSNNFLFAIGEHVPGSGGIASGHSSMLLLAKDPAGGGGASEHNGNILLNPYNWSAAYGNVGIHTAHPEATLHVVGTGKFNGVCLGNDCRNIRPLGGGTSLWSTGQNNVIYYNSGNVGIGTDNPKQKLEVNGNIKLITGGYLEAGTNVHQLYLATNSNVGIGKTPSSDYKLDVDGNIQANGYYYSSDKRFKTNITSIINPLEKILALNGYFFTWKKTGKKDMGVIAQEVEIIFPELVQTNNEGYKSVAYGNLVAPLIEAIKELNDKVEIQNTKINLQEEKINILIDKLNTSKANIHTNPYILY